MKGDPPGGRALGAIGLCYLAVTLAVTWPLAAHLTTSLASDYGDPAFVSFVLTWVDRHLTEMLHGHLGAWSSMWNAPIFVPEPGALTYSEHFLAQAVQSLPVHWISGNPLLAYNLQFLAAFVLTGTAAHLLALRLTGSQVAGLVAGLTYGFSHYRMYWSIAHLHTLSIQWWVFALWAIDCYAETLSRRALLAAVGSLVLLNLSTNYLMAFTAPFTAAFGVWSLARHGRLKDARAWRGLVVAGAASVAVVLPIVWRYLSTRQALAFNRTLGELVGNSVSLASYAIAAPWLLPLALLAVAGVLTPAAAPHAMSRPARLGLLFLAAGAFLLAMGPRIDIGTLALPGPYGLLYDYVPGFSGLRVAHRYVTVGLLFLSLLAGAASAWLSRRWAGVAVAAAIVAAVTRQAWAEPFPMNRIVESPGLADAPSYLYPSAAPPPIYRFVATLPADAVLVELPFGDLAYEILFTYFTTTHERRELNGYSGVLPPSYLHRRQALEHPLDDPDAAWRALAPATHVVVHTAAWRDDTGSRIRAWLDARGARVFAQADGAWLYELPAR